MAEEEKKAEQAQPEQASTEEKQSSSELTKTILKVIIGIVLVALGALCVIVWWPDLLRVIKGFIGLFLVLVGVITIAIARD